MHEPGVVQSLALLATNVARADVARKFTAPDGTTFAFSLPQFYHFTQGVWKRIPPPEDAPGEQLTRTSVHADIQYYAADAAFVEKDLAPYLDDMLARACAAWNCPDDPKITISFDDHLPASPMFSYPEWGDGPLLFQLLPIQLDRKSVV